jgi:hypothetical protein
MVRVSLGSPFLERVYHFRWKNQWNFNGAAFEGKGVRKTCGQTGSKRSNFVLKMPNLPQTPLITMGQEDFMPSERRI